MQDSKGLMEAAQTATGLTDFGEPHFRDGLERLVHALNTEANLNATGEYALFDRIGLHLRQRLMIEDWYKRHPEIDEEDITTPLFGVSLPRTGSSALSYLLSSDPDIRYLRVWESAQPCPPPSTVTGPDPRRGAAATAVDNELKGGGRTPTGIDGAMECQDLMALDFKSQIFQAFAHIRSYSEWEINADHIPTYQYHKRVLKLLQWGQKKTRWRLKAPSHMLHMAALGAVYPDARFVMTHRDPTDVMLSASTVYADIISKFSDTIDHAYIGHLNVQAWSLAMERTIAFRDANNDHRFFDIHFLSMQRDPIGEVRRLYEWLGETVSPEFEQAMSDWWQSNTKAERLTKPSPALFNLVPEDVRSHFTEYLKRMQLWLPHAPSQ